MYKTLFISYNRTVHYIAGPGIGYRIVKNSNDPFIPPYFPTLPSPYDPAFSAAGSVGPPAYASNDESSDDVFKGQFPIQFLIYLYISCYITGEKTKTTMLYYF